MREMIKLFIIVAIFSAVAGGLLANVKGATEEKIDYNKLKYVQGPTIVSLLDGCSNDPLSDNFQITDGKKDLKFFIGAFDGNKNTIAFETFGKGYGGNVGVMVAINMDTDEIVGIGVTTHAETPGMGARAKTDPGFPAQFKGKSILEPFNVTADGGDIDALSGATITSRAVCAALMDASDIYKRLKDEIIKNITV
ncbi:RnfABCDGE type electron transport complex subunit G [Thermodesulfobacteriota bacterium]